MDEDDVISIVREYKINYKYSAIYYKLERNNKTDDIYEIEIARGRGMTPQEALEDLLEQLKKEKVIK